MPLSSCPSVRHPVHLVETVLLFVLHVRLNYLEVHQLSADNRYRSIIGQFADNRYRPFDNQHRPMPIIS